MDQQSEKNSGWAIHDAKCSEHISSTFNSELYMEFDIGAAPR